MKSKNDRIYLIGFSCTGKSSLAKVYAEKFNKTHIDTDIVMMNETGMTIPQIFKEKGEPFFRKMETRILLGAEEQVIATGGGAILEPKNMFHMKQNGTLVLLVAEPETIRERLYKSHERPLLKDWNYSLKLMHNRAHLYTQADFVLDTTSESLDKLADKINEMTKHA